MQLIAEGVKPSITTRRSLLFWFLQAPSANVSKSRLHPTIAWPVASGVGDIQCVSLPEAG